MTKDVQKTLFQKMFNSKALLEVFNTQYKTTPLTGYDSLSGNHLSIKAEEIFDNVALKCMSKSFRFTPYKEKLILKSRHSQPRMVSIPTVRDRVVLKQLNTFIISVYPEVQQNQPKEVALSVVNFFAGEPNVNLWIYGGDLQKFFDTIPHERLIRKLRERIECEEIISLIIHSLVTPTLPWNTAKKDRAKYQSRIGVPQGLSISGLLASIYMLELDQEMKTQNPKVNYNRFVDDILIIGYRDDVTKAKEKLHELVSKEALVLHVGDKETFAPITTEFQFLGYQFKHKVDNRWLITVREYSIEKLRQRIIKLFDKEKDFIFTSSILGEEYNEESRIKFLEKLNRHITGFIEESTGRHLGWIAYFNKINDLELLYGLDNFVKKQFKRLDLDNAQPLEVKSFVRAYHESNHSLYKGYFPIYDRK